MDSFRIKSRDKKIKRLESQIETLIRENELLKLGNQELEEKLEDYDSEMEKVEELQNRFYQSLAELSALKKEYSNVIKEAKIIQKKYKSEVNKLINQMNKDNTIKE